MKFPTKRIFRIFCIWKITEFMPTCLRSAVFLRHSVDTVGLVIEVLFSLTLIFCAQVHVSEKQLWSDLKTKFKLT